MMATNISISLAECDPWSSSRRRIPISQRPMRRSRWLRAQGFAISQGELLANHPDRLKPEVIWNIEAVLRLTMPEIAAAEHRRAAIAALAAGFSETYDLLLCRATIVPPFPVRERYVKSCNGVTFESLCRLAGDWL